MEKQKREHDVKILKGALEDIIYVLNNDNIKQVEYRKLDTICGKLENLILSMEDN